MKKKLLILLVFIIACIGVVCGIYFPNSKINNEISEVQNAIIDEIQNIEDEENTNNEVIVSEEAEEIIRDTIQATEERRGFINH